MGGHRAIGLPLGRKAAHTTGMLASLLAFAVGQIPNGAYGMPELCAKLRSATGIAHTVSPELRDYPVFVVSKSGDPERVKWLVATALRAKWQKEGDRVLLAPVKIDPESEFPQFERQYKLACANLPSHLALPVHDLYRLAPGQMARYGYPSTDLFLPLPMALQDEIRKSDFGMGHVWVKRAGEGIFEYRMVLPHASASAFSTDGQIQFASLPKTVSDLLGNNLLKPAIGTEEQGAIRRLARDPSSLKVDWRDLEKRDPIASICEKILMGVGKATESEMAITLPDVSMLMLSTLGQGSGSLKAVLATFSATIDWGVEQGTLIGKLPMCERFGPSQVKRSVLARYLAEVNANGVAGVKVLSEYVANQRICASDSWADAMMLVMAGAVVDETYIGDYPYNMRLYTKLDRNDWQLLRGGKPFAVSDLSASAKTALWDLLLYPRTRLEKNVPDPALWRTPMNELTVTPTITEESVLIGWTMYPAHIGNVSRSAADYEFRRASLDHEPLYQPAIQQKLKLVISSLADKESIETGFSEVTADQKQKPVTWDHLSGKTVKEFKAAMETIRQQRNEQRSGPPPPRR